MATAAIFDSVAGKCSLVKQLLLHGEAPEITLHITFVARLHVLG
jgi:hypothetical protein